MTSAKDIAKVFAYLSCNTDEDVMTKTRINKLLYYAQGHMLGENGRPLFSNEIDAWQYGPVVATVFNKYDGIVSAIDSFDPNKVELDDDEMEIVIDVWREYGRFTANALTVMTHESDTPWSQVYKPGEKDIHISRDAMLKYFSQPEHRLKRSSDTLMDVPVVKRLPGSEYDPTEDEIWEALSHDA